MRQHLKVSRMAGLLHEQYESHIHEPELRTLSRSSLGNMRLAMIFPHAYWLGTWQTQNRSSTRAMEGCWSKIVLHMARLVTEQVVRNTLRVSLNNET